MHPEVNDYLAPGANVVAVKDLDHYFGEGDYRTQVLFRNNLLIGPGQLVVMTGPSGSGKTTLLTLIGAIRRMQEGGLTVLGHDLASLSAQDAVTLRRNIGFIFQMHNLFDSLSAIENVAMSSHLLNKSPQEATEEGTEILKRLGLGHRIHYRPQALSGGQRQRVAVARALVNKPRLILADEPTAALDKSSSLEVVALLKEWVQHHGSTVIMVTHDNRILDAADRIVNMVDGAITSDVFVNEALLICDFLRSLDFFKDFGVSQLTLLAEQMRLRSFAQGDVLIREGDVGEEFFLLRDGQVDVFTQATGAGRPVAQLQQGQCFGERALLSGERRAATIVAHTSGAAYVLSKEKFMTAIEASPSFKTQLQNLYFNR